jgi:hypothetical protein
MSFLLGSNADFLFPISAPVSVSSVSVLTVQELAPASIKSSKKEPFVGLAGTSLSVEIPTANQSLFFARLQSATERLDSDLGASDDNYENTVMVLDRSLYDSFHILLQKLDNDTGVTDSDYYSSLSYTASGYFTSHFNSLMDKLEADTHLSSEYSDLKISEMQTVTVNFNQDLTLASEVAAVISHAVGASGNLDVYSKGGFVVMESAIKGSDAVIKIKSPNNAIGFSLTDIYGTDHLLLPVSADISVVMVSAHLAAVSLYLDRNVFSISKPYFIVLNDGGSQQVERIDLVRQTLGSVNFVAGL